MKKLIYIICSAVLLFSIQACQDKKRAKNYNDQTQVDQKELTFIKKGIEGGLAEIAAAKVALTNSQNPRVIGFANMMIADHTNAGNQLKKIQNDKFVTENNKLSPDSEQMIMGLSAKKGSGFDKAYMQMMIDDHNKTIDLFNNDGVHANTAAIKKFAEETLPKLKMHLDSANAINTSLK